MLDYSFVIFAFRKGPKADVENNDSVMDQTAAVPSSDLLKNRKEMAKLDESLATGDGVIALWHPPDFWSYPLAFEKQNSPNQPKT